MYTRSMAQPQHFVPQSSLRETNLKGLIMAETTPPENDLPPIGEIYETWLTAKAVAEMHNMTVRSVQYLCKVERLRAVKIGSQYRGEWRIDPKSAAAYKRKMPPAP